MAAFKSTPLDMDVPHLSQLTKSAKHRLVRSIFIIEDGMQWTYDSASKIRACDIALKRYGEDKFFRYLKAMYTLHRKWARTDRAYKKTKRQENKIWWLTQGRQEHYLAKYGRCGGNHEWLTKAISKRIGMTVGEGVDCTFEEGELEAYVPPQRSVQSVCKTCRQQSCRGEFCEWLSRPLEEEQEPEWARGFWRDPELLARLRAKIQKLRELRTKLFVRYNQPLWKRRVIKRVKSTKVWTLGQPQMEGKDGDTLPTISSQNVVLTEANPGSYDKAAMQTFSFDWHQLCTTDTSEQYSALLDRWTYWRTLTWTKDNAKNAELSDFKADLPYDFVNSVNLDGSMPMFVPFKIYKYFRSDIEIKFHINSNKFQVGQLQISWQYLEKFDGNTLDNIYSRCQLPHVLLNAGASNEATLTVPYKFVQPFLRTSQNTGYLDCLYLGTLRAFVTSPLSVGDSGPPDCGISVFVRFPNAKFTGLRDGGIGGTSFGAPQSGVAEVAAAMVAAKMVDSVIGDRNCDKPSDNVNPQYFIPTGTHPWSAGKGIQDRLHSLRLDGSTLGVGRSGIDNSETSIGIPCRVFGMLNHINWSSLDASKNTSGYLLWACDVHPQVDKSQLYSISKAGEMTKYAAPPVSNVAGLFQHWRGSIEFKFDIIASQFHTGRLLCAYIPGVSGKVGAKDVTLAQARNSPYVEFSLQDATSFTFVVPYISDTVWWPRRYTGPHKYGEKASPSRLVLFVLNPLIPMQNIVKEVNIIPYVRAGVDFEVAVPVQPSIGLSDNPINTVNDTSKIFPTSGSYPFRSTNYEGFGDDRYCILYEGTAAFGTASTFHAPETKLTSKQYYIGKIDKEGKAGSIWIGAPKEVQYWIKYIVLWSSPNGNYGIPFADGQEQMAKDLALKLKLGKPVEECLKKVNPYIKDGSPSSSNFADLKFTPQIETIPGELDESNEISSADPQMEERVSVDNTLMPTASLPSTGNGSMNFNERFDDLKDVCRRYQLYFNKTVKLTKKHRSGSTVVTFPAIPHGMALDVDDPSSILNLVRDGHIPVVSSGYIFFRGSLRFKILFTTKSVELAASKIWVQHHPDSACVARAPEIFPNIDEEDAMRSHTYGFYIQNSAVNAVLEFEVPFYQNSMYGLTRKPASEMGADCLYHSLGTIVGGVYHSGITQDSVVTVSVYYSIGDDFSFNVFRGFPMVVYTDEVWPKSKTAKKKKITWITGEPQMEEAQPQMLRKMCSYMLGAETPTQALSNAASSASKVVMSELKSCVENAIKSLQDPLRDVESYDKTFIIKALGELAHVLVSPTAATVAVSVVNIIVGILAQNVLNVMAMIRIMTSIVTRSWGYFTGDSSSDGGLPQSDDVDTIALGGLVFSGVCSLLGVTVAGPSKYPDVIRNINSTVSLTNNVIRLVQNCSDLIVYCFRYVSGKIYPELALKAQLCNDVPEIQQWFKECTYLLDVRVKSQFLYDKSMMSRVFDACVVGSLLVSNGIDRATPGGRIICDLYKDMKKLRSDLFERGVHPDVRFETYPLWLSGEPGIGKSFIVKRLINDLLKSVQYSAPGSLIYDIPAGAKYWSGCSNPAALVSDDIFQVNGTKLEEELANLFMICSSSVLNPPMAAVEDKEKRLNPLIYLMICNSHFPELKPTVNCLEAVYRRRRFLLYARLDPHIKAQYPDFRDASQLPREVLENFEHLEFRYAFNVRDPGTEYSEWMSYKDLLKIISEDFQKHYANERENFKQRMIDMYCLDPNFNESNIIMDMPQLKGYDLKTQITMMKEIVQHKLDILEDPNKDKDVWHYIRKFCDRTKLFKADPEMGTEEVEVDVHATVEGLVETAIKKVNASTSKKRWTKMVNTSIDIEQTFPELFERMYVSVKHVTDQVAKTSIGQAMFADVPAAERYMIPFMYLGKISKASRECIEENLLTEIKQFFNNGNINIKFDFGLTKFMELYQVGEYDETDLMKFMCSFKSGSETLSTVLFGKHSEAVHMDPMFRDLHAIGQYCLTKPSDRVLKEKQEIQEAFERLNFLSVHESKCVFLKKSYDLITKSYEIKSQAVCPVLLANAKMFSCDGALVEHTFQSCVELLSKSGADGDVGDMTSAAFAYVYRLFAMRVFADALFGNHVCDHQWKYTMAMKYVNDTNYCSVRDSLVVDNRIDIKPCIHPCIYSGGLLHYFICIISQSCLRLRDLDYKTFDVDLVLRHVRRTRHDIYLKQISTIGDWFDCFICHKIPHYASKILGFLWKYLPYILGAVGSFFAIKFVNKKMDWNINPYSCFESAIKLGTASYIGPQANYFKFDQPHAVKKAVIPTAAKAFSLPQMSANQRVNLAKLIENNTVLLYATWVADGQRHVRSCRNLMLKGRSMLVLRHYIEEYQALVDEGVEIDFKCYFTKSGRLCHSSISWYDLSKQIAWCSSSREVITSNYGICILPNYVPQFKDITSRFATLAEHKNLPSHGDLYVVNGDSSFSMPLTKKKNFIVNKTPQSSEVYVDCVYSYAKQYRGLCGSVLVAPTLGSGSGAIVGFHVAGNEQNGLGYAEPLYKEILDQFFNEFPQPDVMPLVQDENSKPVYDLDTNLMMYGCVPPKFGHKESGKTKIVPSALHGKIYPVKTEVNPLKPNDPRQPPGSHPLRDGCNKHGSGDVKVFDGKDVEKVKEHMIDLYQQVVRPVRATVEPLTMQQAVCGDINVPYFEPLNWKSSEGFPLSSHRPKSAHDKRWLFDLTETESGYQLNELHPLLGQQMALRDLCFEKNIKPPTVYIDCLKDYRLTPEKCRQQGKTRIFSIAPIQCSLDIRMYMNDFCASIKNTRIENGVAIGINPDSLEWTKLVNYLFEVGDKIITLDYSNYGPCLMSQMVAASSEVFVEWFRYHGASEEHVRRVEWNLDCDIINPVHLSSNIIYQTLNGISSGSPLTGEMNSLPNLFYIRCVYLEIMRDVCPDFANMYTFEMYVRLVVYGDDLIMSVADEIADIFNAVSIRDYMAKHGIKVTPAIKDSEMVPYTSIYEASFLKRGFVEHPTRKGVWMAPIEKQSIEECLNWAHICDDMNEATLECCRASLDLAYSQGPKYYKEHYKKIKKALNEIGLVLQGKNWYERDTEIFGENESSDTPTEIKVGKSWTYELYDS